MFSLYVHVCVCVCVCVCVFAGLRFLVRLCTDMNLKEAQEYANKLKKAEKMQKLREEVRPVVAVVQDFLLGVGEGGV